MLSGWCHQQLARRLAFSTVEQRERMVPAFAAHSQSYPWLWTAQLVDEWMTDLRAVRGVRASTLRGYQIALRLFCAYATDSAYAWPGRVASCASAPTRCRSCTSGTAPSTSRTPRTTHPAARSPARSCRPLLDYADSQVAAIRGAGRKGWLPAFRDTCTVPGLLTRSRKSSTPLALNSSRGWIVAGASSATTGSAAWAGVTRSIGRGVSAGSLPRPPTGVAASRPSQGCVSPPADPQTPLSSGTVRASLTGVVKSTFR